MRRSLAWLVVAAVVVASLVPGANAGGGAVAGIGFDKVLHVVGYAAIAAAVATTEPGGRTRRLAVALLVAVVVGGGVEVLQGFVPGRDPSVADFLADLIGAGLGVAAVAVQDRRRDAAADGER